eukprot:m.307367 g.307367  ORF g.307367 m.307367 type:complete len:136 (-) comp19628_c1_seq7:872-1279(-)
MAEHDHIAHSIAEQEGWNWGKVSKEDATEALNGKPNGTFLVRISTTHEDEYSISLVDHGTVKHIHVKSTDAGFKLHPGDEGHESINHLVHHHMGRSLQASDHGAGLQIVLKTPLRLPEDEDDDADAEEMSFMKLH